MEAKWLRVPKSNGLNVLGIPSQVVQKLVQAAGQYETEIHIYIRLFYVKNADFTCFLNGTLFRKNKNMLWSVDKCDKIAS